MWRCDICRLNCSRAVRASRPRSNHAESRRHAKASMALSLCGICVTVIIVAILVGIFCNNGCCSSRYAVNGVCYPYRRYAWSSSLCNSFSTCCNQYEDAYSNGYCYSFNTPTSTSTRSTSSVYCPAYTLNGVCYSYRRHAWSSSSCNSFSTCCNQYEDAYSFGYCYSFNPPTSTSTWSTSSVYCSGYEVNGVCYSYRRYAWFSSSCYASFSTCCNQYEDAYSFGYCYSFNPPPTTTTSSYCPGYKVNGVCYLSRRYAIGSRF
jgi:hypothetical protein